MGSSTDQEIIQVWISSPAPLLPILHAFQKRDSYLSEGTIRAVSRALNIPLAELFGTIDFYHHFSREQGGHQAPRVCTGPVCRLGNSADLLGQLKEEGATSMPCAGRCDQVIPVLKGDCVLIGTRADDLQELSSPRPRPNPGGYEECVFSSIREPDRQTIEGYSRSGGYLALEAALAMSPSEVVDLITESKLAGRGGAGFPTGLKWKAVSDAHGEPKTVVCNADEGEPGCFKDRALMDHDPHAVLEGMLLAAYATGANQGLIYLRYEYPQTAKILAEAIDEAREAGFLGKAILDREFEFDIHLRRGAGSYVCGEEGSLLNSLEGKHPFPRNRPPYPVTHGYNDLPTVVNNVETLASVPPIVRHGAAWYRDLGVSGQPGTKVISLSGDIRYPGNYEIPIGLPLQVLLYDWAGGPPNGRSIQAVTMAGLSGGFLAGSDLEVTLDEPSIREKGSFLGAGGIMVFDDSRDMISVAHSAMEFFAEESCGKCFPCRIGTQRLTERLAGMDEAVVLSQWTDEVRDLGQTMMATSACGLGMAAPLVTESLIKYFPQLVANHVAGKT
jgi:NADH-quinone oxidoreductase subunit F